ncbi:MULTISPECIES: hypothetical protein [unclassified Nonomuraea]|uniref:hypothetical protein n=1 Tax=unclassified Nonomuraea TaxID=2593643 RepID=UPI0033F6BA81
MPSSDDVILAILRQIASGRYEKQDIDYLEKSIRSHGRNVLQFGNTNVYLERDGKVYINSTVIEGPGAEAIRSVVERWLDEHDGDIPRGALRSPGGVIYGVGLLIAMGSAALGMIGGAVGEHESGHSRFPTMFMGFFIGAILTVIGQFLREREKGRARPASEEFTVKAYARDPRRTHARPPRTSRSFSGVVSKLIEIAGIVVAFIGFYMFVAPSFPLSSGEKTITEIAAAGWPPRLATEGFVVMVVGMVLIVLGKVMSGWSEE